MELDDDLEMNVQGRDQIAGLPKTIVVLSSEVVEAISEPMAAINARDALNVHLRNPGASALHPGNVALLGFPLASK